MARTIEDTSTPNATSGTLLGVLAILLWSASIAGSRDLTERLGVLTAAALVQIIGGGLGVILLAATGRWRAFRRAPRAVFLIGALITVCLISIYCAVGFAANHQQVLEVTILNYLWPSLTLLFTAILLRLKMRAGMLPGMLLATAGIVVAFMRPGEYSWEVFAANVSRHWLPYLLGVTAAVSWALYSALTRRYAAGVEEGGVPVYILLAGLLMAALRGFFPEETHWSTDAIPPLAFMALGPTLLAYVCWDIAMRKGRVVLLSTFSYLTPLLSLLVSSVYLRITPGPYLWTACGLTIAGALICKYSVEDAPAAKAESPG